MTVPIPFRRRTLATLVAAACGSVPAYAATSTNAGQVDYAFGDVTATDRDGHRRKMAKGAKIKVGDTIETHAGRAWLRFRDGGYMSLQPGTEFRVDDYRFEGEEDGNEKSFFSLIKGGMRAITGLIGKTNQRSYRVNTPVATIGIRGTEYLAQLGDSLTVSCGEGVCVVTNDAGEVVLHAGQTVYFKDQNTRGERVTRRVVLAPNPPVVFAGGEFRNPDGSLAAIIVPEEPPEVPEVPELPQFVFSDDVPLAEGQQSGLFMALSYGGDGSEFGNAGEQDDALVASGTSPDYVTAILNNNLEVEQASWNPDVERDGGAFTPTDFADTDTDGVIAWGRWTGGGGLVLGSVFADDELWVNDGNESVHYLVGVPTPETDLAHLKSLGALAVYNLIGATTPTFGDDGDQGNIDFGDIVSVSGALAANFADSTVTTSLALDFTDEDVTINSPGVTDRGRSRRTFWWGRGLGHVDA